MVILRHFKVQGTGSSATIENATIGTASIGTETVTNTITNLHVTDDMLELERTRENDAQFSTVQEVHTLFS